jgi:predicted transcriptional regulator
MSTSLDPPRMIAQLRTARSALGWSQARLANASGVAQVSIARIEAGKLSPRVATLEKLMTAMKTAGVTIIDDVPRDGFTIEVTSVVFRRAST